MSKQHQSRINCSINCTTSSCGGPLLALLPLDVILSFSAICCYIHSSSILRSQACQRQAHLGFLTLQTCQPDPFLLCVQFTVILLSRLERRMVASHVCYAPLDWSSAWGFSRATEVANILSYHGQLLRNLLWFLDPA